MAVRGDPCTASPVRESHWTLECPVGCRSDMAGCKEEVLVCVALEDGVMCSTLMMMETQLSGSLNVTDKHGIVQQRQ